MAVLTATAIGRVTRTSAVTAVETTAEIDASKLRATPEISISACPVVTMAALTVAEKGRAIAISIVDGFDNPGPIVAAILRIVRMSAVVGVEVAVAIDVVKLICRFRTMFFNFLTTFRWTFDTDEVVAIEEVKKTIFLRFAVARIDVAEFIDATNGLVIARVADVDRVGLIDAEMDLTTGILAAAVDVVAPIVAANGLLPSCCLPADNSGENPQLILVYRSKAPTD